MKRLSYADRAEKATHPISKTLLALMEKKKTNLSIAADYKHASQILLLANLLGPHICVFKTHVDIMVDFTIEFVEKLSKLAEEHDFLIFEDRKFADIGNTVQLQYGEGIYKIASWSHITNAHPIPGDGIIKGLKQVGEPLGRGLMLLAEMSSVGALAKGEYTRETFEMAKRNSDFVFGFIGQQRLESLYPDMKDNNEQSLNKIESMQRKYDFIYMTPGVQLSEKGDGLGQQYRTPKQVLQESNCDIIIVGRGICAPLRQDDLNPNEHVCKQLVNLALLYKENGWSCYLKSLV